MRERTVLVLLILCLLGALKWGFDPGLGRNALDGDYYFQIARNVAEGRGLKTDVSLYHQGLKELPAPATIYPLWPLLLGWAGKMVPLSWAAGALPELLFLIDLVLLYVLARRVAESLGGGSLPYLLEEGRTLDLGHAAIVLFGLNPVFFYFTSLPYTEALAFAFLLSALLLTIRVTESRRWIALPAGVVAAAAFLTRSQMFMAMVAGALCLLLLSLRRRRLLAAVGLYLAGAGVTVSWWYLHLRSVLGPVGPRILLSAHSYRETPEIAGFTTRVPAGSFFEMVVDRAPGLIAAFNPWEPFSYLTSFGPVALVVPLAALHLAAHPAELKGALSAFLDKRRLPAAATALAGILMVAPLQLYHNRFLWEWLFHHRHGLPLILVVVVALGYLLARGARLTRLAVLLLVAASVLIGSIRTVGRTHERLASGLIGPETDLVAWLDAQQPRPAVVTTNAQTLSVFSRVGFHWMECREDPLKTRQLVELAGADYVLVYAGEERCAFSQGLDRDYRRVREFRRGRAWIAVYAPPGEAQGR